jgi:ADP-dependent NAD(P)H-hydrate dehydratase / NAD(P)H-hydrate epimerase
MLRALTAAQMRSVEELAVAEQGVSLASLMRAAGGAVARELAQRVPEGELIVLAGPGNNGGDGWVAARDLHAEGRAVRVLAVRDPAKLSGIAADAANDAISAGVRWVVPTLPPTADELAEAAGIVDALLGIGAKGAVREPLAAWVEAANASGAYLLAVDVPTGIDSDSGVVAGPAIVADCTVTFTAPKLGLLTYPAAAHAGEVVVAHVGIADPLANVASAPEVWTAEEYAALVPLPAPDAHKNSRGRVLIVAGSGAFPGAAILAARGAMRAGAGYVTLAVPQSVVPIAQGHLVSVPVVGLPQGRTHAFASTAAPKLLQLAREHDAVVVGPGLTLADGAVATARSLVAQVDVPLVVDADGLNALIDAQELIAARTAPTVLTPHPGELARLLAVSGAEVQADRVFSSGRLASEMCVVVLKGAGTVISGEGRQVINVSGTSALATAGTGDVLAGMTGAFLAQGLDPLAAGALAAYLHGRAGEAAASVLTPVSVTGEDIPEYLPVAIGELLGQW